MVEAVVHKRSALGKRKKGQKKYGDRSEKRGNSIPGTGKKVDKKLKRLFRKRAKEYNSDDDEDAGPEVNESEVVKGERFVGEKHRDIGEVHQKLEGDRDSDDSGRDDEEVQPGTARFAEGCKAFRIAFANIMKRNVDEAELGPVLSAHKKLVVEKLAEEEAERKVKKETKKEKHLIQEKGHVKPAAFLDTHEKFLIGVATKGVVKLFNAVSKAQNARRGLNPSRFKDAKVLRQRRKQVFFSELRKASGQSTDAVSKGSNLAGSANGDQPAWAPLRDSFMLTTQKLKDWDKKPETKAVDDMGSMSDASSDD